VPRPGGAALNFSFVAEHVSDDLAVGALERLLQSIQAVIDESKVPGEWDRHRLWLNDVLSEVWQNRVHSQELEACSNTSGVSPVRHTSGKS